MYASVDFPFPFKDGVGMGLDGNILFSNKASRNQWNFVVALPTDIRYHNWNTSKIFYDIFTILLLVCGHFTPNERGKYELQKITIVCTERCAI